MKNLIYISTIIILLIIAYTDFKTKLIPLKYNIFIAFLGVINLVINVSILKNYIISTLVVFMAFTLIAMITNGAIGGGDIKLFTSLTLIFGQDIFFVIFYTYMFAVICALVLILFKKATLKSCIAFAPYIFLGTLTHLFI